MTLIPAKSASPLKPRRVVITGVGIVSALGNNEMENTSQLYAMRSGVRHSPEWEHIDELRGKLGAHVDHLDLEAHYPRKTRRTMGRVALLAAYASDQAVTQAGLGTTDLQSGRVGLAYGSTSGSNHALEGFCGPLFSEQTMRGLDSGAYLKFMTHTCVANLAQHFKIKGRIIPTTSACTSGSQAIGYGYESIKYGMQDVMVCGGAEENHYATQVTFDLLMATSIAYNKQPEKSPRPFDKKRDGLVIGEGAATLVLEAHEHALARGANILGEIIGYGTNCDGHHITSPHEEGMFEAMKLSLQDAQLAPTFIDYVNAHGTGTDTGDVAESQATGRIFEGHRVPFSSTKSYTGHTLGACGAMELIYCLRMLQDQVIFPTLNLQEIDPRCHQGLDYVKEIRRLPLSTLMTNNFAFGGVNTSLIVQKHA